jgi:propionyl-CoA synthetase
MEEVLAAHPDVAECAVIGVADDLKGQLPMGFLCLNAGVDRAEPEIVAECVKLVRDQIGPVAAFKLACVVPRLPKTRALAPWQDPARDHRRWSGRSPMGYAQGAAR